MKTKKRVLLTLLTLLILLGAVTLSRCGSGIGVVVVGDTSAAKF